MNIYTCTDEHRIRYLVVAEDESSAIVAILIDAEEAGAEPPPEEITVKAIPASEWGKALGDAYPWEPDMTGAEAIDLGAGVHYCSAS